MAALAVAGRRVWWLSRLIRSGQPAEHRLDDRPSCLRIQLVEVFGQRKLLKWSVPGVAHFFTFWGFIVLAADDPRGLRRAVRPRLRASRSSGTGALLGFLEDFFAVAVLCRARHVRRDPAAPGARPASSARRRFYGSHTGAAWLVLFMIFNVIWTLLLYRGAQINTGVFPFGDGWAAFASRLIAVPLEPLGDDANEVLETVGILLQDRGGPRLPGAGRLLQAPAHLRSRRSTCCTKRRARRRSARCCR